MATILIKVIKKLLSLLVKATQWLFVKHTLKKQGTPTRTHPAKDHRQERYVHQGVPQRELPGFLFCLRDEPAPPATRQTPSGLPRCSSRQGWPGRMPVPDGRWLHRDKGKCLWTFSFCSNARSFDRPTVAKFGRENQSSNFISGARAQMVSALHLRLVAHWWLTSACRYAISLSFSISSNCAIYALCCLRIFSVSVLA